MTSKRTTYKAQGMIGRTDDGERVWVEIEIREVREDNRKTTDHRDITAYHELAITGAVARKYCTNADAWGQVIGDAQDITAPAKGVKTSDITKLIGIWQRWHLNSFKAGCDHQHGGSPVECPESGYRYGSAWLVEELPADVEKWVRTFGAKLDGTQARG